MLMVPLAITSTKGWIRRLGKRWQLLHRLIYVSAIAGAIHYLWKVKIITGSPVYYAVIIGALLAFRIVWQVLESASEVSRVRGLGPFLLVFGGRPPGHLPVHPTNCPFPENRELRTSRTQ